jgi:hypothetical protein
MGSEFTPFGDDVKRSSSPESVPQKVPDAVPNFSLGIHLLMDGIGMEMRMQRSGMYAELLANTELQAVGEGERVKPRRVSCPACAKYYSKLLPATPMALEKRGHSWLFL